VGLNPPRPRPPDGEPRQRDRQPQEIDYALERIAAIEKHLGIKNKIAA
jgi:hypothetical protein